MKDHSEPAGIGFSIVEESGLLRDRTSDFLYLAHAKVPARDSLGSQFYAHFQGKADY